MASYSEILDNLERTGNYRRIPADDVSGKCVDFSTNDYMGLALRADLQEKFFADADNRGLLMSSSASRLLASCQKEHLALEGMLGELYGRSVLLFNSGYHANTGIISSLASEGTLIVADKLSHASIIDGILLSRAPFVRFRHNDYARLERILAKSAKDYERVLVVTESVFSMDGDCADLPALVDIKRRYPNVLLYVDEAHAFGVCGAMGLGYARSYPEVDIIVGTFGKAAASSGAFTAVSGEIKKFLVNRARSFIFSTALSPMTSAWTRFMIETLIGMDRERERVAELSRRLNAGLRIASEPSHIQPLIVGDARRAVELSRELYDAGYKALPIRTPTVPAGTERLRFSISASMSDDDIDGLVKYLEKLI